MTREALRLELHLSEALLEHGMLPAGWRQRVETALGRVSGLYGLPVSLGETRPSALMDARAYAVLVEGLAVGVGTLWPGHDLAVPSLDLIGREELAGFPGIDPVTGYPSWWVRDDEVDHARSLGYWTSPAEGVLAAHLEALACRLLAGGVTDRSR